MRVVGRRRPHIDDLSFPSAVFSFLSDFLPLLYIMTEYRFYSTNDVIVDRYSVLKGQGPKAFSLFSAAQCLLSTAEYHCSYTKHFR